VGTGDGATVEHRIPPCYSEDVVIDKNRARQLLLPEHNIMVELTTGHATWEGRDLGYSLLRRRGSPPEGSRALLIPASVDLNSSQNLAAAPGVRWVGQREIDTPGEVWTSLRGTFRFQQDDPAHGQRGLRSPQLGAVYSVLGYWTTRASQPATVVMPTGTGKTETMLSLFVAAQIERLLVLVPSDALRDQIARKFEGLGILQELRVVAREARRPIVGRVMHRFASEENARRFVAACNVVIATPSALSTANGEVRAAFLDGFSHLFVDEAHHVAAGTWQAIRDAFGERPVVQFTATPFREDGRHLGGRILYAFPLREAQRQGYFSTINYVSVVDFDNPDRAIAERAVEQLRTDLDAGHDHLLMARVRRIGRADEVCRLYAALASDLNPVIIHSGAKKRDRDAALEAMLTRHSRIVICVDMLGEGFDLPALKIAAIHDPHKSLGITLQFVGRFARVTSEGTGDATMIVGRPELDYDDTLRRLYAEDADWNGLIRDLSEWAVGRQQGLSEFEASFATLPEEVSLRSLLPKMSAVVYRTTRPTWDPEGALDIFPEEMLLTSPIAVNERDGVSWFVTEERSQVGWGDIKTVEEVAYHLYVLYWDAAHQLLYINSSNNDGTHEDLARAVCRADKDSIDRVGGEVVFRVMGHVNRLVPTNVGVLDVRNRARRFSNHVGADVSEGFPVAEAQTKTKTHIFAYGFEEGVRVNYGASLKGRIWSHRVAGSLKEWVDWCDLVGSKLLDATIDIDAVMANFIRPQVIETRPRLVPLALEWPWELFTSTSEEVQVVMGEVSWPLVDVSLDLLAHETTGPIPFRVSTPNAARDYELRIASGNMSFKATDVEAYVATRRSSTLLSEFLHRSGLIVLLEQEASIVPPAMLLKPDRALTAYDTSQLRVLDWSGVNLRKESQGASRDADSIQARMIEHLRTTEQWDLMIDDDSSGEIADIVALRMGDDALDVLLMHCKYSGEDKPGRRLADLYEVCGQAQKSVRWKRNISLFLRHLIRREKNRKERHGRTGIIHGKASKLYEIEDRARLLRPRFTIGIAQPGVAKELITKPMLELLASTEVYVHETALAPLHVYCSP